MSDPPYQYNVSNDDTGEDYSKTVWADDEEQALTGAGDLVGVENDSGFTVTVTEADEPNWENQ
jgi:hypothetical protein